ncbi:hypothetical protein [Microbacterium hydrocarbonoxydans]|uniref:hypothetical protein n=1 Tax=Microbacterium hydrocarbonoxydans TaxID=273678 RepID=UPI003D9859BC
MLIALLLFGLLGLAAFGVFGFWTLFRLESDQKKAEANAEESLNALFDGTPDVTFSGGWRSMKYETVIVGAKKRGYKLAHQAGDPKRTFTLMFEKAPDAA